jgi:hypothetical protein
MTGSVEREINSNSTSHVGLSAEDGHLAHPDTDLLTAVNTMITFFSDVMTAQFG